MFWRKLLNVVAVALLVLSVPLILLLSNLYLLATPGYIKFEYGRPTFPESPGFTEEERFDLARASVIYLRSDQGIDALQKLVHNGEPLYNSRELIHMADVKIVMYWATVVFWGAVAAFVLASIYVLWRRELRGRYPAYVFWGAVILFVGILAIGLAALVGFDTFFFAFHRIFFTGDSWLFLATDSLIRLFPIEFWMDAALAWIILALGEAVVVGSAAYLWPGWKHGR